MVSFTEYFNFENNTRLTREALKSMLSFVGAPAESRTSRPTLIQLLLSLAPSEQRQIQNAFSTTGEGPIMVTTPRRTQQPHENDIENEAHSPQDQPTLDREPSLDRAPSPNLTSSSFRPSPRQRRAAPANFNHLRAVPANFNHVPEQPIIGHAAEQINNSDPNFPPPLLKYGHETQAWYATGIPRNHEDRLQIFCVDSWTKSNDPRTRYFADILFAHFNKLIQPPVYASFLNYFSVFDDLSIFGSHSFSGWNGYCDAQTRFQRLLAFFYPELGLKEDNYWRQLLTLHRELVETFPNFDSTPQVIEFDKQNRANFSLRDPTGWRFPTSNNTFHKVSEAARQLPRKIEKRKANTQQSNSKKRALENEYCFRFNASRDGCESPCTYGRIHSCAVCKGDHRTVDNEICVKRKLPPSLQRMISP